MLLELKMNENEHIKLCTQYSDSWEENLRYEHDKIKIYYKSPDLFSCEKTLWIYVEDILVYEDGWKHKIPKEMKVEINNIFNEINKYNKECNKQNIINSYNQITKAKKLNDKQNKIRKYENEKLRLIKLFSNKQ